LLRGRKEIAEKIDGKCCGGEIPGELMQGTRLFAREQPLTGPSDISDEEPSMEERLRSIFVPIRVINILPPNGTVGSGISWIKINQANRGGIPKRAIPWHFYSRKIKFLPKPALPRLQGMQCNVGIIGLLAKHHPHCIIAQAYGLLYCIMGTVSTSRLNVVHQTLWSLELGSKISAELRRVAQSLNEG
jgi:hypothetical protein